MLKMKLKRIHQGGREAVGRLRGWMIMDKSHQEQTRYLTNKVFASKALQGVFKSPSTRWLGSRQSERNTGLLGLELN